MCHKLRTAMGRTSADLLSGDVEVDETFIGGVKTGGKRGRGAPGKAFVVVAVEIKAKGFGRCRLQVVEKIDAVHLGTFLHATIAPGSVIISDALNSYPLAIADTYGHNAFNIKRLGFHAHEVLPGVHRVASLLKRWLEGTHQSGVSTDHLQAYLNEFTFRFSVVIKAVVVVVGEGGARGGNPLWTMGTRWRASRSACGPLREGSTRRCSDGSGATRRLEECRSSQSRVCVRSPHGLCAA